MELKERRMSFMGKATNLTELINTLDLNPLFYDAEISDFYVDTSDARGSDTAALMEFFLRTGARQNKKFLFAGHSGSGKSTELSRLSEKIKNDYMVVYLSITEYVNFIDASFSDLIFGMLKSLVDTAASNEIIIERKFLDDIISYWRDESVITDTEEENYKVEVEASAGVSVYKIFSAKIRGFFQQSNTIKTETTRKVEKTMSTFLNLINNLINQIKKELNERELLIIVDDLDKLAEKEAYSIFKDHCIILTSINTNIIYTFPVFMHYNPDYRYISMNFDESFILSIIMTKTIDGEIFPKGIETLTEIVQKRADLSLFENHCVNFAIEKSGGSIRNTLILLRSAAAQSFIRYSKSGNYDTSSMTINMDDLNTAYRDYKNSLKRTINKKYLPVLKEVYKNKTTVNVEDNNLVMDLFKTFAIIEYNCDRWCDLNPAVLDYLREIKEIEE